MGRSKIPGLGRYNLMLHEDTIRDLDTLARVFKSGSRSQVVRDLVRLEMDRQVRSAGRRSRLSTR